MASGTALREFALLAIALVVLESSVATVVVLAPDPAEDSIIALAASVYGECGSDEDVDPCVAPVVITATALEVTCFAGA